MDFGWINFFGAVIVAIMMVPNVVYALKNKGLENLCTNRFMNITEQVGRYACIILMWFPLLVWEFGFSSVTAFLVYIVGNGLLLIVYIIIWGMYFKGRTRLKTLLLAAIPACIFLLSGLLLHHWLLVMAAVMFAISHVYVTLKNYRR